MLKLSHRYIENFQKKKNKKTIHRNSKTIEGSKENSSQEVFLRHGFLASQRNSFEYFDLFRRQNAAIFGEQLKAIGRGEQSVSEINVGQIIRETQLFW